MQKHIPALILLLAGCQQPRNTPPATPEAGSTLACSGRIPQKKREQATPETLAGVAEPIPVGETATGHPRRHRWRRHTDFLSPTPRCFTS